MNFVTINKREAINFDLVTSLAVQEEDPDCLQINIGEMTYLLDREFTDQVIDFIQARGWWDQITAIAKAEKEKTDQLKPLQQTTKSKPQLFTDVLGGK